MQKIGLVGCAKGKRAAVSRAKDLYTSDLFVKTRAYAEKHYDGWRILSAKHHLISPESRIGPYDETLTVKRKAERRKWAHKVFSQIVEEFPNPETVEFYFHAGDRYKEFLVPLLVETGYPCKLPLQGLKIGEQLAWYKRRSATH